MLNHKTEAVKCYQDAIMKENREKGCKCAYDRDEIMVHKVDCPSPMVENLPNV